LATNTIYTKALELMYTARAMAEIYEENKTITKYVHSTSRGHEAAQIALGLHCTPNDWVSPYYRDDALMLSLGFTPYELMLQLLAKADDPFSAGRSYYCHPSSKTNNKAKIIHQSSATGMQAIPTTGIAQGLKYWKQISKPLHNGIAICSLGDGSVTEGEVAEAWQFAILKKLPIIYFVQDNEWGISATAKETRVMDAITYAKGFPGLHTVKIDGTNFSTCYQKIGEVVNWVREFREPFVIQVNVPLLNHHTSGVRKEFYRTQEELDSLAANDCIPKLENELLEQKITENFLEELLYDCESAVTEAFEKAKLAEEPSIELVTQHVYAPTPITQEQGTRAPAQAEKVLMVDAALHAIDELMQEHEECLLYGQDVGARLGGVFREAATLGKKYGDHRVFNTAIQEAYIAGSTIGLSAVGLKPIVEVQFADYIYPALNQLVSEISKSCYLSAGKFPISMILRVPTGAYGSGGPYHSGSVESTLLSIKGIKVVYPSNAADMKGLMKAAYYDPNPVIMLEHKGLYWSKVPGTDAAKTIEPAADYILPLGKANLVVEANKNFIDNGETIAIITYGMGVHWALQSHSQFVGKLAIVDLRTLEPLDEEFIYKTISEHGKAILLTEEQVNHSFMESLAGRITKHCFHFLDKPIEVMGALNVPAIAINTNLEKAILPNSDKLNELITKMLAD
jgi:2-oxoisovalerate dehydrogenase E1 component